MEQDYAKAFRIIRAAFGLRQSELAERMPITASQLSLIEAGKRQPSLRVVNALAAAVGVPAALVSLLASAPGDVESKSDEDISDLARALLRVLVTAKEEPQQALKFGG
jgi:transcriptional regulator with XRE-family HTH domain